VRLGVVVDERGGLQQKPHLQAAQLVDAHRRGCTRRRPMRLLLHRLRLRCPTGPCAWRRCLPLLLLLPARLQPVHDLHRIGSSP